MLPSNRYNLPFARDSNPWSLSCCQLAVQLIAGKNIPRPTFLWRVFVFLCQLCFSVRSCCCVPPLCSCATQSCLPSNQRRGLAPLLIVRVALVVWSKQDGDGEKLPDFWGKARRNLERYLRTLRRQAVFSILLWAQLSWWKEPEPHRESGYGYWVSMLLWAQLFGHLNSSLICMGREASGWYQLPAVRILLCEAMYLCSLCYTALPLLPQFPPPWCQSAW